MTAPGNSFIEAVVAIAFLIASGYALGRIHQWYRDGAERDRAYRSGYDLASGSIFDMAIRKEPAGSAVLSMPTGDPTRRSSTPPGMRLHSEPGGEGRHSGTAVGDSRRRIATGRLDLVVQGRVAS